MLCTPFVSRTFSYPLRFNPRLDCEVYPAEICDQKERYARVGDRELLSLLLETPFVRRQVGAGVGRVDGGF